MRFTDVFSKENIILGCPTVSHDDAIEQAGHFLMKRGYVNSSYIDSMKEREAVISTFVGQGAALPHGLSHHPSMVHKSGVVVMQYPEGIDFHGKHCYLIIGISSTKEDHLYILSHIARILSDQSIVEPLWTTTDLDHLYESFIKEDTL